VARVVDITVCLSIWVHETQWQQQLLQRYGAEICLLDATYKTSRYALPLFFSVLKRMWTMEWWHFFC